MPTYLQKLEKVEKQFPHTELEIAASEAFEFLLRRTKEMRSESIAKLSQEASMGKAFKDRNPVLLRKVTWCDAELERLGKLKKAYIVKPFQFWFEDSDYLYMKLVGFRKFVLFSFDKIIYDNSANWEQEWDKALA